jgi:acetyl/propionyl-CoA carboxylase alpha subunit
VFESLLVANRGEIARRILRTAARMGLRTVAVHSEADADLPFVREADDAVLLGPAPAASPYLDAVQILEAAARTGAGAIHPGDGFLAADAAFARAVADAGLVWVGPPPEAIEATREWSVAARPLTDGDARRLEVEVLGLADGRMVALGDRDCSVRRGARPMLTESPAPGVDEATRSQLLRTAVDLAERLGLRSAATVEFRLDAATAGAGDVVGVHPNLRVGQAATELVTGVDVVEEQLRAAGGKKPVADLARIGASGHAIEVAVYADADAAGSEDELVATLRVHGTDRGDAVDKAASAVAGFRDTVGATNLGLLAAVLDDPEFRSGGYDAGLVGRIEP